MPIREFELTGRQAVVIGGSRGIGRGIVLALAEAGADVAVVSQHIERAGPTAERAAEHGVRAQAFAADATSLADVERMAKEVLVAFPELDIVVNSVGDSIRGSVIDLPDGKSRGMTGEDWRWIVDMNLSSVFNGCKAFGPHLLARRQGSVINVSGVRALRGGQMMAAYAAAKGGISRFTESVALEWAPYGLRVNAIAPGLFPDPEQESAESLARMTEAQLPRIPLGRVGDVRDVGLMAVYLASDAAAYVTGTTMVVDGGNLLV